MKLVMLLHALMKFLMHMIVIWVHSTRTCSATARSVARSHQQLSGAKCHCIRLQEVGLYTITVTARASAVGSATDALIGTASIRVVPNPIDAPSTTILAPATNSTSTAGGRIAVRLQPRDRFGNPAVAEEDAGSGIDTFVAEVSYDSVGPRTVAAASTHTDAAVFELSGEGALADAPTWAVDAWTPRAAGLVRVAVVHLKTLAGGDVVRTEVVTLFVTVCPPLCVALLAVW